MTHLHDPHGGKWGRNFSMIGKKGSAKKAADLAEGTGNSPHEPVGLEGATISKHFDAGNYQGVVTKSLPKEGGVNLHHVAYFEDGDVEDLETGELGPLLTSAPRPNARGGGPLWLRRHTRPSTNNTPPGGIHKKYEKEPD